MIQEGMEPFITHAVEDDVEDCLFYTGQEEDFFFVLLIISLLTGLH